MRIRNILMSCGLTCLLSLFCTGCITTALLFGDGGSVYPEDVEALLEEKYSKPFTVSAFGDRWDRNTATAYAYADEDPSLRFKAMVTDDGVLSWDAYTYRLVCRQAENIINDVFAQDGITTVCIAEFIYSKEYFPPDTSLTTYLDESHTQWSVYSIVIKDSNKVYDETVKKCLRNVQAAIPLAENKFRLFTVSSSDFDIVREKVETEIEFFDAYDLENYGAVGEIEKKVLMLEDDVFSEMSNQF